MSAKLRVAVLFSGRGSNLRALCEDAAKPGRPYEIIAAITNRPGAAGIRIANDFGVPVHVIDHTGFDSREAFDAALDETLEACRADLAAFAGFMRILTPGFVTAWAGRLVNIHPSLLPRFKGLKPQQQALDAGVSVSGCTVHFVTPGVDEGPIIDRAEVPVMPGDTAETLSARILEAEHALYPRALTRIAEGAVRFSP